MKCPRCGDELQKRKIGAVEVGECAACKGIWFDEGELGKAKDETDPDLNWLDFELWQHEDEFHVAVRPIKCPRCDVQMAAIEYGTTKVEINYCTKCKGVWLDTDEFKKIIDALIEELLTKSVHDYVRASVDEAKEIVAGPESAMSEWKDFLTVVRMLEYRILSKNPRVSKALTAIQTNIPIR
jgi:Zn-finger nucleic acid-binding protein